MKKFIATLKHDGGKIKFHAFQPSLSDAIRFICRQEGCPETAIINIVQDYYYVSMTDRCLSGWGLAEGKINKLVIECETWEEAETIERNAKKRSEMKYVNISVKKPRFGKNVYPSWKKYSELGSIWKQK